MRTYRSSCSSSSSSFPSSFPFASCLILLPIFSLLCLQVSCAPPTTPVYNPINKHYYQLSINGTSYSNAKVEAQRLSYQGHAGYLATVTSRSEFDWIISTFAPDQGRTQTIRIGADQTSFNVPWTWTSGTPEAGISLNPVYTQPHTCPHFCYWVPGLPNDSSGNEYSIALSWDSGRASFDDWPLWDSQLYLIEYGNFSFISTTVSSPGGVARLRFLNYPQWTSIINATTNNVNASSYFTIMMSSSSSYMPSFYCNNITIIKPDGLDCYVGAGYGVKWDVNVTYAPPSSNGSISMIFQEAFSYSPPVISTVSEVSLGKVITLTGSNFGANQSEIIILLGGAIPCSSVRVVTPHEVLTCNISSMPSTILPISISVGNQNILSDTALIYNPHNDHYYRLSPGLHQYSYAKATIPPLYDPVSNSLLDGYLATITSPKEREFIGNFMNTVSLFWIGLEDLSRSNAFYWGGGPESGLLMRSSNGTQYGYDYWNPGSPTPSQIEPDAAGLFRQSGYINYILTQNLRYLAEYGNTFSSISSVTTSGGRVTIMGLPFGPSASLHDVTIGSFRCSMPQFAENATMEILTCIMPPIPDIFETGASNLIDLNVTVSYLGQTLTRSPLRYSYDTIPYLYSMDPTYVFEYIFEESPPRFANLLLRGDNFGRNASYLTVSIGGSLPCIITYINNTDISCTIAVTKAISNQTVQIYNYLGNALLPLSFSIYVCGDGTCSLSGVETCDNCPYECCETSSSSSESPINATCPGSPPCSGHGLCELGACQCEGDWSGADCALSTSPFNVTINGTDIIITPIIPYNSTNNSTSFSNSTTTTRPTTFSIALIGLRELNASDHVVKTISIANSSFSSVQPASRPFFKILSYYDATPSLWNVISYFSKYSNSSGGGMITFQFGLFDEPLVGQFASHNFSLPSFSLKCSVRIDNYTFVHPSHRLQVIVSQNIQQQGQLPPSPPVSSTCSKDNNTTPPSSSSNSSTSNSNNNLAWVSIAGSDGVSLYATYPSNVVVDDRYAVSRLSFLADGDVGIEVPYFKDYVVIDPNFAILLGATPVPGRGPCSQQQGGDVVSGLATYQIIVAVVVCVVVVVIVVIIIIVMMAKKRRRERKNLKEVQMDTR
eukprot:TRINITY_DN6132_c0_g1_i1.p1 TRINITY_DN6132_c0_g1~~TRINITY_DN6132_c0_g1_i1.p1  ORF type:complete len:1145 (+),score=203.60 TRINITY_DN6132_c0_g1_i1:82-3435(+)